MYISSNYNDDRCDSPHILLICNLFSLTNITNFSVFAINFNWVFAVKSMNIPHVGYLPERLVLPWTPLTRVCHPFPENPRFRHHLFRQ